MAGGGIGEMTLAEMVLSGAAAGGAGAALTGKDPLKGALLGGAMGGIGGAMFPGAPVADVPVTELGTNAAASSLSNVAAPEASGISAISSEPARGNLEMMTQQGPYASSDFTTKTAAGSGGIMDWIKENPKTAMAMGLGATALFGSKPSYLPAYKPVTYPELNRSLSRNYQPYRPMAEGGITSLRVGPGSVPTAGVAPSDLTAPTQEPSGLDALAAQYGVTPDMVAQARQTYNFAAGGPTQMAVGGKLLRGNGDGMSDSIPANISGRQEARLADGEFVIPADVVSHLGNGSTDAGAKQLYGMMDKVRKARTGRKSQGRQINPQRFMPT